MEKVIIYSQGLISMSVCAEKDLTVEEITEEVNAQNPTGISSDWAYAEGENFNSGETNPCLCNQHPDKRKHYLFHC